MPVFSGRAAGRLGAAGGAVYFEWIPDPEVVAQEIIRIADYIENMQPPLQIAKQIAIDDMRDKFVGQYDPDGNKWVDWAQSYRPYAERHNIGEILQQTMALQNAATNDAAYRVTENSVFFSTAGLPEYWLWHETGTGEGGQIVQIKSIRTGEMVDVFLPGDGGRGKALPQRRFVGVTFEAQLKILETFEQWFDGAIAVGVSPRGRTFARHARRGPGGRFVPKDA